MGNKKIDLSQRFVSFLSELKERKVLQVAVA